MSTTNFPIKVKEVVLTAEEYESVVERIKKIEEKAAFHKKVFDESQDFIKNLHKSGIIEFVQKADYLFDPENEIHIKVDALSNKATIYVSDKRK